MVRKAILTASQKNKSIIKLRFQNETEEEYTGVVVRVTRKIVVFAGANDFEFDGYHVFPRDRIKGYQNSKYEKCHTKIMKENKQLSKVRPAGWINSCQDITSVLAKIKRHGIWPAIETIYNNESAFYIGPITSLSKESFLLYCYDAAGKWEKEYKFAFTDVVRIEWASKYCTHFNKYMRAAHKNRSS